MGKGIWFGKLADGTEASISDLVLQEITVVQAARVRLANCDRPLGYDSTLAAAQHLRKRFPELNREETPTLYSETRFSRTILAEDDASKAVTVKIEEVSLSTQACQEEAMATMQKLIMRHPSSLSRIGWRLDILWASDGNDVIVWFIFAVSHNHADGVAMHAIVNYYLDAYVSLLQERTLVAPTRLPLHSALPHDHTPLSLSSQAIFGFVGWLVSKLIGKPGSPAPKLLTESMAKRANITQLDRQKNGKDQHEGPIIVDFIELDKESTRQLCSYARSMELTVGTLVHGALFFSIAKRYFQEHPDKNSLALEVPVSVNMRGFLQPPLPDTVLAPQQGELMITLKITRREIDLTLASNKAMMPLVHEIALEVRRQLQKSLAKPEKLAPLNANILLASLFRNGLDKMSRVQYIGDAWFSNVGLFRPSAMIKEAGDLLQVESTLTLNATVLPAYEFVWCNSVAGGSMTLSMVTDETMGRNQASAQALLNGTADVLNNLICSSGS